MTDKKRFTRARLKGTSKIHSAVNLRIQNLEVTGNEERKDSLSHKSNSGPGHPLQSRFAVEEMPISVLTSASLTMPALEACGWLHEA
jgi:hypothetical protein